MTTTTAKSEAPQLAARAYRREDQAVEFTGIDARIFKGAVASMEVAEETAVRLATSGNPNPMSREIVDPFFFDTFNSLHRHVAKDTGFGSPLVADLLRRLRNQPEYHEMRMATVADETASLLGACSFVERAVNELDESLKEKARQEQEARERADQQHAYAEALSEDGDDPDARDDAFAKARQLDAQAERAADALKAEMRSQGQKIENAVRAAAKVAGDQATGLQAACQAFGTGSCDPTGGLSPEQKMEMAKLVSKAGPNFKRLSQLIGRLSAEAIRKQASKMTSDAGEIVDAVLGSEVAELMEDELAALVASTPVVRRAARARFAEDAMLMHEVEQREPQARGGIVVLFDESGSMAGEREAQGKAVAIALAHVAMKQRRAFVCHFFQSSLTQTIEIEPSDAHKRGPDGMVVAISKLVALANRGTGGGTDFNPPLLAGCATVEKRAQDRADILLLTDGCGPVAPQTVERVNALRAKTGAKVYTMLIGGEAAGMIETVRPFSDKVWSADSLLKGSASELFDAI